MTHLKHIFKLLLLVLLVLTSCKSSDDTIDNDCDGICNIATAEDFRNIRTNALEDLKQQFRFNAEDGMAVFTSLKGVQISINGNCLTLDGNAVTGQVNIEYVELFDKGSMLTTNKPTMGLRTDGNKALLISGGEFLVNATQDGNTLDTNCQIQLKVPSNLTGGTDNDMTLWNGAIDTNGDLAWEPAENTTDRGGVFGEGNQYYAFLQQFGWSNIDRFYNDPRPKTTILAQAPLGYDYTNSAIYLSYDGEDTGLASLDTFEDGLFSEHYGQIPIGLECHLIFITEDNDNWKYIVKATTIVEGGIITFTEDETTVVNEEQLIAIINDLP